MPERARPLRLHARSRVHRVILERERTPRLPRNPAGVGGFFVAVPVGFEPASPFARQAAVGSTSARNQATSIILNNPETARIAADCGQSVGKPSALQHAPRADEMRVVGAVHTRSPQGCVTKIDHRSSEHLSKATFAEIPLEFLRPAHARAVGARFMPGVSRPRPESRSTDLAGPLARQR